jgi:hypothetical protein
MQPDLFEKDKPFKLSTIFIYDFRGRRGFSMQRETATSQKLPGNAKELVLYREEYKRSEARASEASHPQQKRHRENNSD